MPLVHKVSLEPSEPHLIAFRFKNFAALKALFDAHGFCAAQSPQGRACSRIAGHGDGYASDQHWAESPRYLIVEAWYGGELLADDAEGAA